MTASGRMGAEAVLISTIVRSSTDTPSEPREQSAFFQNDMLPVLPALPLTLPLYQLYRLKTGIYLFFSW